MRCTLPTWSTTRVIIRMDAHFPGTMPKDHSATQLVKHTKVRRVYATNVAHILQGQQRLTPHPKLKAFPLGPRQPGELQKHLLAPGRML